MDDNYYNQNGLFIGRVLGIDPKNYMISIRPQAGRMGFNNVRVISPNTAYVNNRFRGFAWMPHPGDWVVCGYLEGYPDHPICLGAIYNYTNTRPPEAATDDDNQYQYYDYVVQHQTGSFIRIRNLNQPTFINNNWIDPAENLSQIIIRQQLADETKYNDIKFEEVVAGNSTIEITHHTGASIKIDIDGNIIITPTSGEKIKLGSDSSNESLVLGDSFKTWLDNFISSKLDLHIHPTGVGPSGPPTNAPMGTMPSSTLSVKAKTET